MPNAGGVSHIVLTVHGIRTFGDWADRLAKILRESDPDTLTLKHGYGWVSLPAFLIPPFGWDEVRLFRKELKTLARRHPKARFDIVCHSFGTYVAGHALRTAAKADLPPIDTIIVAGSVLTTDFPWSRLFEEGKLRRVVNECGLGDVALIASQLFGLWKGMAGRLGFNGISGDIFWNRYHNGGHGIFFSDGFMETYWVPLLTRADPPVLVDFRVPLGFFKGVLYWLLKNAVIFKLLFYVGLPFYAGWLFHEQSVTNLAVTLAARAQGLLARSASGNMPGLLVAVESMKRRITPEGERTLDTALVRLPKRLSDVQVNQAVQMLAFDGAANAALVAADDNLYFFPRLTDSSSSAPTPSDPSPIDVIALSGDGQKAYYANALGKGKVWETATGRVLFTAAHDAPVKAAAFSADGARLFTAATLGLGSGIDLYTWDAVTGRRVDVRELDPDETTATAFSPDGRLVAAAHEKTDPFDEAPLKVWDTATGKVIAGYNLEGALTALAFNSDGRWLAGGDEWGAVYVWDNKIVELRTTLQRDTAVQALVFNRNRSDLDRPKTQSLHDLSIDTTIERAFDQGLTLVPPGLLLAAADQDKTVTVWEAASGIELASMVHDHDVTALSFGPHDAGLFTLAGNRISIWQPIPDYVRPMRLDHPILAMVLGNGGNSIFAIGGDGVLRGWRARDGVPIAQSEIFNLPSRRPHLARAALSRAAQGILIAGAPEDASGSILLWEGSSGLPLPVGPQAGGVFTLAASGKRVAIASDKTVRVIDLDTAKQRAFVASAPVTSLALSPEGSWLATGTSDGAAGLWSFDSGEQALAIRSSSPVAAIALSSATKWIAIAYADARLSVIEAGNGARVFSRKTSQPVPTLEFGEADVLAVGGRRTEILALPSGLTLAARDLPGDPVALRFTPQDRRLLIALGASIEPWFWDSRQKIVEACERATRNLTPDEWRKLIPEKSYRATCELPR